MPASVICLLCVLLIAGSPSDPQVLQSEWERLLGALKAGIELYAEKHPGKYPTIMIDEPTTLFPKSPFTPYSMSDPVDVLKRTILSDLTNSAVIYGVDHARMGACAKFMFASSSAAMSVILSMSLDICICTEVVVISGSSISAQLTD